MDEGEALDKESTLRDLGFDSMLSVELRNRLEVELGLSLPATLLFDYPTLAQLEAHLIERSSEGESAVAAAGVGARETFGVSASGPGGSIGISGVGCRFAGCHAPGDLWATLEGAKDTIAVIPRDRFNWEDMYDPDRATPFKSVCKWGSFMEGIAEFDASFFSISPREASAMDPKNRMLLETGWECIERGAVDPLRLQSETARLPVGVYVGIWPSEYSERITDDALLQFLGVGTAISAAAGRVSYFFGLKGACLSIDTACSSSLVALHAAVVAMETAREDCALCFGTNSVISAGSIVSMSKAGMLSPDGRCKTYDQSANGYVRGEGCGALFVRMITSGGGEDHGVALASIVGHAVIQDGRSNGLTAPNGPSQVKLIREALKSLSAVDDHQ
ncbi:MAG: type I polyketide synthase, partial [Myxococcales bacterium]|nr:type I polyketide synthase [Myxococcales bacterium]